ncbi:FAD-dependent oxidoreductase [Hymenobacter sp. BT18]|uniref:flavin monoamine oxidase family protein n=1 Tax=Hymenobacter sp. BT18 TaxID=2835648 RepID=UPI00143E81F0|nr:NAD(P)/FAD-dependent oxidoreductase [Hymenobacter sp. BT18]QIX60221.1 FAD-dependent oxidoreductase [Hymenobacter sp. BT18]
MPEDVVDLLIIGAGAAGLLAAREVSRAGRTVALLEARNRVGGRIYTFQKGGFTAPVEGGAEFIHGDAPLTKALLREAQVPWLSTAGRNYEVQAGQVQESTDFLPDMPALLDKLQALPQDMSLADFLHTHFPGPEHQQLRERVTQFAEGYNAADARLASAFALRDEWAGGGAEDSPRPVGGYGQLMDFLQRQAQEAGAALHLATAIRQLSWQPGQVVAEDQLGHTLQARQALITVPTGVLRAHPTQPGHLAFSPELPAHRQAAAHLGFGDVIKVLLEFEEPFWPGVSAVPDLGFIFSDAPIPTWWSQRPVPRPLLTGWLGGPAATRHRHTPDAELLELALNSLAATLTVPVQQLQQQVVAHRVLNWGADPWAQGAYSYVSVEAAAARQMLSTPVEDTLFFAGEGLYEGPYTGTVEAALVSGRNAAWQILQA